MFMPGQEAVEYRIMYEIRLVGFCLAIECLCVASGVISEMEAKTGVTWGR